jgi:predicted GIY-YIG superfamily endonuclease
LEQASTLFFSDIFVQHGFFKVDISIVLSVNVPWSGLVYILKSSALTEINHTNALLLKPQLTRVTSQIMLVPDFKQLNIPTAMCQENRMKQVQVALKCLLFNQKQKCFRETTTLIAYF